MAEVPTAMSFMKASYPGTYTCLFFYFFFFSPEGIYSFLLQGQTILMETAKSYG